MSKSLQEQPYQRAQLGQPRGDPNLQARGELGIEQRNVDSKSQTVALLCLQERGSPVNRGLLLLIGTVVAVPVLLWMVRHEEPKRDSKAEPKPEVPKDPVAEVVAPVVSQPAVPAEPVVSESAKPEVPAASPNAPAAETVASEEPVVGESSAEPSAPETTPAEPVEAPTIKAEHLSQFTGVIVNDDGTSQELSVNSATENKVFLKKTDGPFPEWVTTGARLQLKLDVPGKKKNQLVVQAEITQLGDAELTCDLAAMNAGLKKRYMTFLQALKEPGGKA
jgi:hypothetical protein